MSQQQSFNPDSFKTKGEKSDREPAPTDSEEEAEFFRVYYKFGDHVSKPKHTSGFILPVDGCSVLELAASVGYDSCKRDNLQVLDSHTLLFIAGSYLRIYKMDTHEETYIRCTGDGSVNCLAVAKNFPAFASGEEGTKPDINIFGYPSCRLRKILKNGTEKEYVSMMFDPISGDLLASLGGEPDYNLTIWHWQKEVPLLRRKAFSQDLYKVAFSDDLFGCLVTSGLGHIRFWTMAVTFTGLKLNGAIGRFGVHEPSNIEAFLSFPDGKVISGSEEGIMYLWEEALLKAKFTSKGKDYCHRGKITQMFMFEGEILTLGEDGYIRTWSVDDVIYVEPDFHGERFHLNALQEVLVDEHAYLMHMVPAKPKSPECYDWYAQDKVGRVWSVDLSITMNARPPRAELQFHAGPVIACAASLNTHLVATAGQDGAVRIFDCLQKKELMSMKFSAPASSLLWVPLTVDREGASVIAGFADGIVRKIVFCGEKVPENTEKKELRKLEGKLSQVFKAHEDRVTSMTFSHKGDIFVSGSMDKTMFFFRFSDTEFIALGWLSVPTSVKQLVWTPFHFVYQGLLAVCDDGIVVQIRERHLFFNVELTPTLQFLHPRLQLFKFQSIKSEIQHAEKIDRLKKEIAEKKEKERAKKSEEGGEEQTEPDEEEIKKEVEEYKLVRKEEENWQPYYPDSPSPILQAVYSKQEDCFWLTLGEYDAGYIYRCHFSQTQYQGEDTSLFLHKPVKAVVVPDCSDVPITVLKINQTPWQHLALIGFQDGRIRLVQLSHTEELHNISMYCDLNAHDKKNGSLTGMEFAFDRSYLVTTGMDGNIFIFSYTGLLEMSARNTSTIPFTISHHALCSEDITSNALSFAEQINHTRQQKAMKEAEELKKQKRLVLKRLENQVKYLLIQNDQLPVQHRLARQDLLVNINLKKEDWERRQEKIREVHKMNSWQLEKTRLLMDKMKTGFLRHEELPCHFTVKALKQSIQVKSYRARVIFPKLEEFLTVEDSQHRKRSMKKESYTSSGSIENKTEVSMDDEWQHAYAMTQRRSIGLTGTVARSLKMALDKSYRTKQKEFIRKADWAMLYDDKVRIDKDDPKELIAIEHAKQTIGDIKLKADPLCAVAKAHTYSKASTGRSLAQLDTECCDKINAFNKKLFALRKEKLLLVQVFETLNTYLYQKSGGMNSLPNPPQFSEEEIPEASLVLDEQTIYKFKQNSEALFKADQESESIPVQKSASHLKSSIVEVKKPLNSHIYYKGDCSDVPEIVMFARGKDKDTFMDMSSSELFSIDDISALQEEVNMIVSLEADFEESLIEGFLSDLMEEFDNKLRALYKERAELDLLLKQADLVYISKLEEFLLSEKTFIEEMELMDGTAEKTEELKRTQTASLNLRKQIVKKTEESELISKQLSELWLEFQKLCEDKSGTRMWRFLARLFKRKKAKKKIVTDDEDEDEEMSESESFSTVSSDLESDASVSLDLNYCPEELEPVLYVEVLEMQTQHQNLDEQLNETKQDLIHLAKDLEQAAKDIEMIKRDQEKIQQRVDVFFQEKIKMINEIITLVPLLESRIFSRVSNGLVLNTKDLYKLQSRVCELKHDIRSQIHTMKEHSWQDVAIRRANRLFRERINTWETKCDEEIVKKFGKPIRLAELEFVTVNPKVELLRYQMITEKDRQVQEQKELDEKIRSLKKRLYNKVAQNTLRLQVKAELITKKRSLEDSMEFRCDSRNMCLKDEPRKERVRYQERRKLGHLLHQQVSVMHGCCEEMTRLWQRGTSTTCKMLPSSKHLSTATRKVRVAVPVSIHPPRRKTVLRGSETVFQDEK